MSTIGNAIGIVKTGLVLYYDPSNTRSYSSGLTCSNLISENNNCTLVSGTTFSSNNFGVLVTDGVNDYISMSLPSIGPTYSISIWLKPVTLPSGAGSEVQVFGSPNDTASITLYAAVSNTYKFLGWNGSTRFGTTTITANNWYNFVLVNSGNTVFYLNGDSDGTFASTATLSSGTATFASIYDGAIPGYTRFLNSNLGGIMFYNKALSATEVLQNYKATKTRFGL